MLMNNQASNSICDNYRIICFPNLMGLLRHLIMILHSRESNGCKIDPVEELMSIVSTYIDHPLMSILVLLILVSPMSSLAQMEFLP